MSAPAAAPQHITSRDNPWLKELRRLAQDNAAPARQGRVWIEGDHLCRAALARGRAPEVAVFAESAFAATPQDWWRPAERVVLLPDALFASISGLASPARMGFVMAVQPHAIDPQSATVVLDRVQDAGNVGSILRSAAAFGFSQVLALPGTAALWSAKVLRAGMGAHFGLRLVEGVSVEQVAALQVPLLVTSSHAGALLHTARLPRPCAWVLGHEGQGVQPALAERAAMAVRIAQPGGEESLNVAAAAAICLHASGAAAPG